jgi:hypothetical protein
VKALETKVLAGAVGAAGGGALGNFLLWVLGVTVWHTSAAASASNLAVSAVPAPVAGILLFVVPGVTAFVGGYLAPHTHRPDLSLPAIVGDVANYINTAAVPVLTSSTGGYPSPAASLTQLPVVPSGPAPGAPAPVVVGEPGPEIVNIPAGATVIPSAPPVA